MNFRVSGIKRLMAGAAAALLGVGLAAGALADVLGQPVDRGIDLQPAASQIRADQIWFHNWIVSPIIIGIAGLVLVLLAIVIIRFNKRANRSRAGALQPHTTPPWRSPGR